MFSYMFGVVQAYTINALALKVDDLNNIER